MDSEVINPVRTENKMPTDFASILNGWSAMMVDKIQERLEKELRSELELVLTKIS